MPQPTQRKVFPLNPALQARVCRQMACDLRDEHARGMGPIDLTYFTQTGMSPGTKPRLSRLEASIRMDEQAARWEHEVATGELNVEDRARIGEPTNVFNFRMPPATSPNDPLSESRDLYD